MFGKNRKSRKIEVIELFYKHSIKGYLKIHIMYNFEFNSTMLAVDVALIVNTKMKF